MKKQSLLILIALTALLAGCESTQQKAYDLKADTVGTHRVVEVLPKREPRSQPLKIKMRYELVGERSVRLWLGDKNEKVMVGNLGFIIRDQ